MKKQNYQRGSIIFIFYFIVITAILAGAVFVVGLREHQKINGDTAESQNDGKTIFDDLTYMRQSGASVESPYSLLKKGKNSEQIGNEIGLNTDLIDPTSDPKVARLINLAKNANYDVQINHQDKENFSQFIKLEDGFLQGNDCYNNASGKECFPQYRLGKALTYGDLNGDKKMDAIVSLIVKEKNVNYNDGSSDNNLNGRAQYYVLIDTGIEDEIETLRIDADKYSPKIISVNIDSDVITLLGAFHDDKDAECCPSVNKIVKMKLLGNIRDGFRLSKVGEAKILAEQSEDPRDWQIISTRDVLLLHIDYTFYLPRNWSTNKIGGNREHNFTIKIDSNRQIQFDVREIEKTCPEYQLAIAKSEGAKIRKAQYIELDPSGGSGGTSGTDGVGGTNGAGGTNNASPKTGLYLQYEAGTGANKNYSSDICFDDRSGYRKVMSFKIETGELPDPYFAILDKIIATLSLKTDQTR